MTNDSSENLAESGREFEPLAAAVASGLTVRGAAESLGFSERSAYRFSGSDEFKLRVAELRSEIASQAIGRLTSALLQAVDTLQELLAATNEPKTRLDAAKLILNSVGPLAEHCEFRIRIDKLEGKQ